MRILYAGNGPRGNICLKKLLEAGKNIVGIIGHVKPSSHNGESVIDIAKKHAVPAYQPENINDSESLESVRKMNPELIIMSGYNQILKKEIISIPTKGCINLHGGKLPNYRGSSILNWAIINGEKESAASIIFVDEGIDTGDIVAEEIFPIAYEDTIEDVVKRTLEIFSCLLLRVVNDIEKGKVVRRSQPKSGTYWHKRKPADGLIDWKRMTAFQMYNLVRALTHPYPGAFTFLEGKKLYVWKVKEIRSEDGEKYGGSVGRAVRKKDGGVIIVTKGGGLLIERVQTEGLEEEDARDVIKIGATLG